MGIVVLPPSRQKFCRPQLILLMMTHPLGDPSQTVGVSLHFDKQGLLVGQCIQEPINGRRGRDQVLKLQIEDSLEALGPLGPELSPHPHHAIQ